VTAEPVLLTRRYEELRAAVLAHAPAGHGLALLRQRGTPAWMRAWEPLTQTPEGPSALRPAEDPPTVAAGAEVARLLTTMALAALGR
jgi:hypothetical protein